MVELPSIVGLLLGALAGSALSVYTHSMRPHPGTLYRVIPPASQGNAELLFRTLHGLLHRRLRRVLHGQPALSFELVGEAGQAYLRIFIPDEQRGTVQRLLRAAIPGIQLVPIEEVVSRPRRAATIAPLRTSLLPIQTDQGIDSLIPLLAVLGEPRLGERLELQILIRPHPSSWQTNALRTASRLRMGQDRSWLADLLQGPAERQTPTHLQLRYAQAIEHKAEGLPFEAVMRLLVTAESDARAQELLRDVVASLRPFAGVNAFRHRIVRSSGNIVRQFRARQMPLVGRWIASSAELAELWHVPDKAPPHFLASASLTVPPPLEVARAGRRFGLSTFAGVDRDIAQSLPDALLHTHICGPTGTGKSELALNLILQDIEAGRGVALFDPKRDLVAAVRRRIPASRIDDVILISAGAGGRVVGLNPLESRGGEPERLAEHVLAAFHRTYANWWGPRTEEVLRSALLTLVQMPNPNLAQIPALLTDAGFRAEAVANLTDHIGVGSFWRMFDLMGASQRADLVAPVLNRLRAFLSLPAARRLLCQVHSTIDLADAIKSRRIILIDLGGWGETSAHLAGSMIFAALWQAARARLALDQTERSTFMVYADEFGSVINLAGSFAETLEQARGLGLGLTLLHQHMGQLAQDTRESILTNARTRVIFQCGPEDSRTFAREFAPLDTASLMNLPRFNAAIRMAVGGRTSSPFTIRTVPAPAPTDPGVGEEVTRRSLARWGRPIADVDEEIRQSVQPTPPGPGPLGVGRRRRHDAAS